MIRLQRQIMQPCWPEDGLARVYTTNGISAMSVNNYDKPLLLKEMLTKLRSANYGERPQTYALSPRSHRRAGLLRCLRWRQHRPERKGLSWVYFGDSVWREPGTRAPSKAHPKATDRLPYDPPDLLKLTCTAT